MKNELAIFNNQDFGQVRIVEVDGKVYFVATDIAKILKYSNPHKAINDHCPHLTKSEVGVQTGTKRDGTPATQIIEMNIIPEGDVYRLITHSKLPAAEKFERWVFDEVLPTIRKTGGYVANDDLFIDTYFSNVDDATKNMLKANLVATRKLNKIIEEQKQELRHKDDVIIGYATDISLAEKRQILNRIVRKTSSGNYFERYKELYKQFELKYHCNLKRRLESEKNKYKPQIKNVMDYIDRAMNKIPELYDIAIKLYENDVNTLVQEMYELNEASND